jgi:DNA-directed RNA polymerase subunit RPC12/RpoP
MEFRIPPQYQPVESAFPGIEVYAPAPEGQAAAPVVEFKCPQCGAATAFHAGEGGLKCSHCGYYEQAAAETPGEAAEQHEFTVESLEQANRGWGEERVEVDCQSCGAQLTAPAGLLSLTCAFCGSNKVLQRQAAQDQLRPRFVIPFQVEAERCQQVASAWLGSSWMTPAALRQAGSVTPFTPVYLPFWTFDSVSAAAWRAEVGHPHTERHKVGKEWHTRTVIRWRWESGQVRLDHRGLLVPGAKKVSRLLLQKIEPFDLEGLTEYAPSFLAGIQAQSYELPLEDAWEIARERMREDTRRACHGQASTSHVRNFSMELDFSDEGWRYILLPVYLSAYRFHGAAYQVMVNGQNGKIVGQRPVDWTKVWLACAALVAPGALLGLIGLLTLALGVGAAIGGVGLFLLLAGGGISAYFVVQAMRMDDA